MLIKRFDSPGKVSLKEIPTNADGGMTEPVALARFATQGAELAELQELLFAAGTHSLLVVLQGRDTAGKDGTIKGVAGAMNPGGTRVASFKVPTPQERAHDFLWRIHKEVPGRGETVFFNRSHYEDVLVVRVHNLVPDPVWKARYDQIIAFEKLLTSSNTIVVKFCLHISKSEQEKRLLAREADSTKAWKLNTSDWEERPFWDKYTEAYEDAISKTAAEHAPWYVVPGDHKWFRNVAIAEALIETLRPYKADWKKTLDKMGATQKAAIAQLRRIPPPGGG